MEIIRETGYGCWVWEINGYPVMDEDGAYMLVFGTQNDMAAVKALTQAARGYGIDEGKAVFMPDVRPVTNEEYEEQVARAGMGLTPDIWDIAAIKEEMKAIHDGR